MTDRITRRMMDRGGDFATLDKNAIFAPTELGKKRSITPEGYLLCEDVAIARTGTQTYHVSEIKGGADEKPLEGDPDGRLIVERTPEQVFDPVTAASFEGKSVTIEHPNDFVTPETYRSLEVGQAMNVHRGEGIENDLLLADLLIKDPAAIAYVNKALPEVSCGYNADYVQTAPGKAEQVNIVGNHIALVDRGRAGPRCAIKDHAPQEDHFMKRKGKFFDNLGRLLMAFQTKDEKEIEKVAKEMQDDEPDDMDMTMDARLRDAEKWIADRKARDEAEEKAEKEEQEKKDKEAKDALLAAESPGKIADLGKVFTGDTLTEIFSRAEILSPGVALPTNDSAKVGGTIEALMRKSLATADATEAGRECIKPFLLGRTLAVATADSHGLVGVFTGAAELMRQRNNRAASATSITTRDFGKKPPDNAELNRLARERWAGKK